MGGTLVGCIEEQLEKNINNLRFKKTTQVKIIPIFIFIFNFPIHRTYEKSKLIKVYNARRYCCNGSYGMFKEVRR